ncbi:MAG: hypothetical protein JOZ69_04125 [Myxococcales bacterium]|nr:hypothetical protein [Myxococcales bacterium]
MPHAAGSDPRHPSQVLLVPAQFPAPDDFSAPGSRAPLPQSHTGIDTPMTRVPWLAIAVIAFLAFASAAAVWLLR